MASNSPKSRPGYVSAYENAASRPKSVDEYPKTGKFYPNTENALRELFKMDPKDEKALRIAYSEKFTDEYVLEAIDNVMDQIGDVIDRFEADGFYEPLSAHFWMHFTEAEDRMSGYKDDILHADFEKSLGNSSVKAPDENFPMNRGARLRILFNLIYNYRRLKVHVRDARRRRAQEARRKQQKEIGTK